MTVRRRSVFAATVAVSLLAGPSAMALDGGTDASADVVSPPPADTGTSMTSDGGNPAPVCPDAVTSASAPVMFTRMGAIDFGPGTGASSIGDHSTVGLDYNLLFSGTYSAAMAGTLNMTWPTSLTVTAVGTPMGGMLSANFGLRMTATLWVLGVAIPIPLDEIISDHDGSGMSTFTPWAWNYEGTDVHIPASAWRDLYDTTVTVAGSSIDFALQMRYDFDIAIQTQAIGFPNTTSTASVMPNLAVIMADGQQAIIPPPPNGSLDLLTRWQSQLRYQGSFEFRVNATCSSSLDLTCLAATGILDSVLGTIDTGPLITSTMALPDPYDQMPHFSLPVEQIVQTEVDFGNVHVGDSVTLPIVVSNPGMSTLAVDPDTGDDPFAVGAGSCITAGASANVPATFHPTSIGTFQQTINVYSNGIIGAPTQVTLVGSGVTGPTVRPGEDAGVDAGQRRADGGEYVGAEVNPGCLCRTAGAGNGTSGRGAIAMMAAGIAIAIGRRRKRARVAPGSMRTAHTRDL